MKKSWETIEKKAMFFVGAAGIAHETLLREVERPYLLALFGTMMGLPFLFRREQQDKVVGTEPGTQEKNQQEQQQRQVQPPGAQNGQT